MHLEREGVLPWGPGHVSLPFLVSEGPVQALLFVGAAGGYGMHGGFPDMHTLNGLGSFTGVLKVNAKI